MKIIEKKEEKWKAKGNENWWNIIVLATVKVWIGRELMNNVEIKNEEQQNIDWNCKKKKGNELIKKKCWWYWFSMLW